MANLRMMVTLPTTTGVDSDLVVNTWHFRSTDVSASGLDSITTVISDFYTAIKTLYPSAINFAGAHVKWYDLGQPKPRPPIHESPLGTTGTGTGTGGPSEVAICLSYHANRIPGLNAARSRGRIYLGPFGSTHLIGPRPPSTLTGPIVTAAGVVLVTSTNASWKWIVWSQKQADDPQGNNFPDQTVTGGWVDDAYDTQRRRGIDPSVRNTFGVPMVAALPVEADS